jgi:hypothetical protein
MGYYDEKKRELTELLELIGKEKVALKKLASNEEHLLELQISKLDKYKKEIEENISKEKKLNIQAVKLERNKLNDDISEFERHKKEVEGRINQDKEAIIQLAKEKTQGFPWLAQYYDDYFRLQDLKMARYLEDKPHPAKKAAEANRQIAKERRESEKAARIANYLLQYCKFLAPWLDAYIGIESEELDIIIKDIHASWEKKEAEFDEEFKRQIGPKQYESLSPSEKLQKKLDWYWEKPNKSNWRIGRDYERYVGYLYEKDGWSVYFHGIKGCEDLGRDLICQKGKNTVDIVQCKYWAKEKVIHEKHIYYLFGTTVEYYLDKFGLQGHAQLPLFPDLVRERNLTPKLITTVDVSPKGEQVAKVLKVSIEKIPFQRYPSVKCNVARRTGEKIFHLPFDQQYDTTLIEEERLECYVDTIAEAEALGFRHAYRWKGELQDQS